MPTPIRQDWTRGPARSIAAGALGGAAVVGLAWAIASGRGTTAPPAPRSPIATPPPLVLNPPPRAAPTPPAPDTVPQETAAIEEPSQEPAPPTPSPPPPPAPPPVLIVNINKAGTAELELLPGIGPALAQRIVEHRAKHGRFRRVEDLEAVKGIGPKTLERLRPFVRVD